MTAETQIYHQYRTLPSDMKCFRQQEQYQGNSGVRPSTLLKLSEHIKSKRSCTYSLNLLREPTKENRAKRKIVPYTSAFRPSVPTTVTTPIKPEPKTGLYNPLPIKPVPEQKVYYVSGLELLSWVSSKVDRLEEFPAGKIKQEPRIKQESR